LAERDGAGRWQAMWARRYEATASLAAEQGFPELPQVWQQLIERAAVSDTADGPFRASEVHADQQAHLLALPLRDRDQVFAVLLLVRGAMYGDYSSADITMFEATAWRSAIALVNSRLYGEIEQADQQKNRFLSMLAHELRNPLAPIRSAVDVLRLCGQSQDEVDWARDVIDRQVSHLVRLVDDLLDISRVTLGKIRLVLEPLDAADLVTAAVEISQPLIEKNSHQLSLEVPDEPVLLKGDRARLTQVLANLLNNAAKYTPPGGTIVMSLLQDGEDAVFRIRDSGIGIPPHMLEKVFDMFIQIENSLDRAHGGLGIGLTLVRELVSMHQGSITVTSDGPGRGSEFIVRIPCSVSSLAGDGAGDDRAAHRPALRT
jgi:signal transduction histidine kinase